MSEPKMIFQHPSIAGGKPILLKGLRIEEETPKEELLTTGYQDFILSPPMWKFLYSEFEGKRVIDILKEALEKVGFTFRDVT
jgi:hypothetical protein